MILKFKGQTRHHTVFVRNQMLRALLPILFLGTSSCIDIKSNLNRNALSVEIDRSFEESVSQTYIKIKSNDEHIYCISSMEIDRLYSEMSDHESTDSINFDKDVNYIRGVDITEPIFFVDDIGMKIFVDNFDRPRSFEISYFKCVDLLNKSSIMVQPKNY